jgi:hypothetical protein
MPPPREPVDQPVQAVQDGAKAVGDRTQPYQQKGQKSGGWFWALPGQSAPPAPRMVSGIRCPPGRQMPFKTGGHLTGVSGVILPPWCLSRPSIAMLSLTVAQVC